MVKGRRSAALGPNLILPNLLSDLVLASSPLWAPAFLHCQMKQMVQCGMRPETLVSFLTPFSHASMLDSPADQIFTTLPLSHHPNESYHLPHCTRTLHQHPYWAPGFHPWSHSRSSVPVQLIRPLQHLSQNTPLLSSKPSCDSPSQGKSQSPSNGSQGPL